MRDKVGSLGNKWEEGDSDLYVYRGEEGEGVLRQAGTREREILLAKERWKQGLLSRQ